MNSDTQHEDIARDGTSETENSEPTSEPQDELQEGSVTAESEADAAEAWGEEFSPEELAELFGGAENVPAAAAHGAVEVIGADSEDEDDDDPEAGTGERLQKLLARSGVASRRAAEELIRTGRVTVNNVVVTELGRRARPEKDRISVDGKVIRLLGTGSTVVALYKPRGCVATKSDPQGRTTVMAFLPKKLAHLHPVGRLDFDTSGLLLLTDDGELTNLLLHPSHGVEKRYHARVRGVVSTGVIDRLQKGVALDDGVTLPCRVRVKAQTPSNALLEIVLREGRNRQIRRMLQDVGHPVSALRRVRLGPIDLSGLTAGTFRELLPGEVHQLKKAARATKAPLKSARPFAYKPRPSKAEDKTLPQVLGRPSARPERSESRPERPAQRPPSERRAGPPTPAREGNSRPYASREGGSYGAPRDNTSRESAPRGGASYGGAPRSGAPRTGAARPSLPRDDSRGSDGRGSDSRNFGGRNESSAERPNYRPGARPNFSDRPGPRDANAARGEGSGSRFQDRQDRQDRPERASGPGRPQSQPRPSRAPGARPDSRPDARSGPRREERPNAAGGGASAARPQGAPQKRGGSKLAKRIEDRWK
jgi:23S rRNA pseudouridine2605 synthase